MKRLILTIVTLLCITGTAKAQTYLWSDSLAVSTVEVDTTFDPIWHGATLWFEDCDGWVKIGTVPADTVNWATKKWVRIQEHQMVGLWLGTEYRAHLWRLSYKSYTGTGALFIIGFKLSYQ